MLVLSVWHALKLTLNAQHHFPPYIKPRALSSSHSQSSYHLLQSLHLFSHVQTNHSLYHAAHLSHQGFQGPFSSFWKAVLWFSDADLDTIHHPRQREQPRSSFFLNNRGCHVRWFAKTLLDIFTAFTCCIVTFHHRRHDNQERLPVHSPFVGSQCKRTQLVPRLALPAGVGASAIELPLDTNYS